MYWLCRPHRRWTNHSLDLGKCGMLHHYIDALCSKAKTKAQGILINPYLLLFSLLLFLLPRTLLCASLEFSLQLECSQLFLLLRRSLRQATQLWNLLVTPGSCSLTSTLLLLASDKGGQKPKAHGLQGLLQHAHHRDTKDSTEVTYYQTCTHCVWGTLKES